MIDELLRAATCFDWISPTLSIAQNVANGPSHTFLIPIRCGWTGREISDMLRNQGIKTWGHMIVHGHFMITVREEQAGFAQELLQRDGLPVRGGPVANSRRSAPPTAPRYAYRTKRKRKSRNMGGVLDDLADLLLG